MFQMKYSILSFIMVELKLMTFNFNTTTKLKEQLTTRNTFAACVTKEDLMIN